MFKSKTIATAVAGIVIVWMGYAGLDADGAGPVSLKEAIMGTVLGLLAIFQRLGTAKAEASAERARIAAKSRYAGGWLLLACVLALGAGGCRVTPEAKAASHALARDFPVLAEHVIPDPSMPAEKQESVRALLQVMGANVARLDREIND